MTLGLLFRVKPSAVYEIDAPTDGTDVTASIQSQFDAIPDGPGLAPTIVRFPAGRYHTEGDLANNPRGINGILRLDRRNNLIIEGPESGPPAVMYTEAPAVPYDTSVGGNTHSLRRHVYLTNCRNVTIRNLAIEGSNYTEGPDLAVGNPSFWNGGRDTGSRAGYPGYRASWELEHAFAFHDCTNIVLEDFEVDAVWGDGVYVGNNVGCRNVIIRRGTVRFPGRQGVAVSSGSNMLIEDITVIKGRRSGIDLEPHQSRLTINDVELSNCYLEQIGTGIAALGAGDVSDIYAHDLLIVGNGGTAVVGDSAKLVVRKRWTLRRVNRSSQFGSPTAALQFEMCDDILIDGCVHPVATTQGRKTVKLENCGDNIEVTNCDWRPGGCEYLLIGTPNPRSVNNITACP